MNFTFNDFYKHVEPAVMKAAPKYNKFGFTADDCMQEAAVAIMGVMARGEYAVDNWLAFMTRCVLNHLASLPRRYDGHESLPEGHDEAAPESRVDTLVWDDLLHSAPGDVKLYLKAKVIDELTWDQTCCRLACNSAALSGLRGEAGRWLLAQVEGRKWRKS